MSRPNIDEVGCLIIPLPRCTEDSDPVFCGTSNMKQGISSVDTSVLGGTFFWLVGFWWYDVPGVHTRGRLSGSTPIGRLEGAFHGINTHFG